VIPSQWPYLLSLGGSKPELGVFVASFSFGRMFATVPLGFLSDKISMRAVFNVCSLLQVAGHLMYMVAPNVAALLLSRVIVGVGSATMSVCRAHVSRAVPKEERTHHFAYLSALQFIGFAVLPGAGGLLAALPEVSLFDGFVQLNSFTYPGLVLVLSNLLAIVTLYWFYLNAPEQLVAPGKRAAAQDASMRAKPGGAAEAAGAAADAAAAAVALAVADSEQEQEQEQEQPDWLALMVCLLINICFRGVVAELETLASPVLMERFQLSVSSASYTIGTLGSLGLIVYFAFKPITLLFSDRQLVAIGLALIALGGLLLGQSVLPLPLLLYSTGLGLIWSLAYPLGQTAVLSLFSKILAGLPAGGFLGVFSACGSLARVIFATLSALLWNAVGTSWVFILTCVYGLASLLLTWAIYPRLVPHRRRV